MAFLLTASFVLLTLSQSDGFTTPHSRVSYRSNGYAPKSFKNDEGDPQFYDDFGDSFIGNSSPDNSANFLQSLESKMIQTREIEAATNAQLSRNWRRGNWSVRGFSLAKQKSFSSEDQAQDAVHISAVAAPTSASLADMTLIGDNSIPEYRTVAVGRTDGSIFLVRLGQEYLTKFASSPQLVETIKGEDLSVRVEDIWVEQDQIKSDEQYDLQPFEVLLHFQSSDDGEECHSIAYHDIGEDKNNGYICTACGESGRISVWTLPMAGQQLQSTSLNVHKTKIVALRTVVLPSANDEEQHLLISASLDGTIAFHDLEKQGQLLLSFQCITEDGHLTCADVSNPSIEHSYAFVDERVDASRDMLFVGKSNGYVMGYDLEKVLSTDECGEPDVSFRAHGSDSGKGTGVSAIKCGGDGKMQSSSAGRKVSSLILITGGEDGLVKQW